MTNSITQEEIEKDIGYIEYRKFGEKTVVCFVKMKNGFELVTSAHCFDPEGFVQEVGEQESYSKAIEELMEIYAGMKYLKVWYEST